MLTEEHNYAKQELYVEQLKRKWRGSKLAEHCLVTDYSSLSYP